MYSILPTIAALVACLSSCAPRETRTPAPIETPRGAPSNAAAPSGDTFARFELEECGVSVLLPVAPGVAHDARVGPEGKSQTVVYLARSGTRIFGVTCSLHEQSAAVSPASAYLEAAHRGATDGARGEVISTSRTNDTWRSTVRTQQGLVAIKTYVLHGIDTITLMSNVDRDSTRHPVDEFLDSLLDRTATGTSAPPPPRLAPEVIQKTVRAEYGRFRLCYEAGLARNAQLEGTIVVRFVITEQGTVRDVRDAGSTISDAEVTACALHQYERLRFPKPQGGIVTVVYPILFSPDVPEAQRPAVGIVGGGH